MVTVLKNKCTMCKRNKFLSLLLFYIIGNLFYTIGDITYQSPLVTCACYLCPCTSGDVWEHTYDENFH